MDGKKEGKRKVPGVMECALQPPGRWLGMIPAPELEPGWGFNCGNVGHQCRGDGHECRVMATGIEVMAINIEVMAISVETMTINIDSGYQL